MLDETHDAQRRSWVESANAPAHDFPIQNLPLGVFSTAGTSARLGVAIGERVADVEQALTLGLLHGEAAAAAQLASGGALNRLMAQGHAPATALRRALAELLCADGGARAQQARTQAQHWLWPADQVQMHLPAQIGGFTDFLSSVEHIRRARRATHPDQPVPDTLWHMPLAYNGRASSVRPSGHNVVRPHGQSRQPDGSIQFGPAQALDFEMELGAFVAQGNPLGTPVRLADASEQLFGYCLLNDWSARDIQRWESLPLGPFLGKSFSTVISPWIVTAQALAPFMVAPAPRDPARPPVLPHLCAADGRNPRTLAIGMQAFLCSAAMRDQGMAPVCITDSAFARMDWTFPQMVVHHASNGCDLRPGDLLGSGTVSCAGDAGRACLAEFEAPLQLPDGSTRRWLLDGDEIVLRATAAAAGHVPIGFGECRAMLVAARPWTP